MKISRIIVISLLLLSLCVAGVSAQAQTPDPVCVYYFTGIGCPHCANVDPLIFGEWLDEYPDLIVVEFELYRHQENGPVFQSFVQQLDISPGVPNLLMGINGSVAGDGPIISTLPSVMKNRENITNQFGNVFFTLDRCPIAPLEGSPQVWHKDRILIKAGSQIADDTFLKELLIAEDIGPVLKGNSYEEIDPVPINISGPSIEFDYAIRTGDWILQWNGDPLEMETETPAQSAPLAGYLGVLAIAIAVIGIQLKRD
jgi:hypothetical protein